MALDLKPLAEAIDRYLAKADDDLRETLEEEGFIEAAAAVEAINRIEDEVTGATQDHFDYVMRQISTPEGLREFMENSVPEVTNAQELENDLKQIFRNEFDEMVRHFTFNYVIAQDPQLDTTDQMITEETQDKITTWSRELSKSTVKWMEPRTMNAVRDAVKAGNDIEGVTKILYESGIRDTEWKARRLATTEVLRMESMGQQEAFIQDPSCYKKRWVYTFQAKEPRENHMAINGQEVFKREPFNLPGGYTPMYPRDPSLPAGESINCHCIMEPVVDENVLGMTPEERADLRQQAMDEVNRQFEQEHGQDNVKSFLNQPKEEQLRTFGGKEKGAPYRSLITSGVVSTDEQMERLYKYDKNGRRHPKELHELRADGIFTIDSKTMEHSIEGKRSHLRKPKDGPSLRNGGMIKSGGHSQEAIEFLEKYDVPYNISKTYSNGVRIGGYKTAEDKWRGFGETGQSWFPKDWDNDKIRDAGTYTLNRYAKKETSEKYNPRDYYYAEYEGVTVIVMTEKDSREPISIYPDLDQELTGGE